MNGPIVAVFYIKLNKNGQLTFLFEGDEYLCPKIGLN